MDTTLGPLELREHRAYWRGTQVDLSLTEFAVARYLARRAGSDVSYWDIYATVRAMGFAAGRGTYGCNSVRSCIKRIRKKFRDVDAAFDQIENYESFGYRWRKVETPVFCEVVGHIQGARS